MCRQRWKLCGASPWERRPLLFLHLLRVSTAARRPWSWAGCFQAWVAPTAASIHGHKRLLTHGRPRAPAISTRHMSQWRWEQTYLFQVPEEGILSAPPVHSPAVALCPGMTFSSHPSPAPPRERALLPWLAVTFSDMKVKFMPVAGTSPTSEVWRTPRHPQASDTGRKFKIQGSLGVFWENEKARVGLRVRGHV